MLEVVIVMMIMSVAVAIFASTVTAGSQQRAANRERALAADAARNVLESMRNEDLRDVFRLYNRTASDDPAGGAPGARFAVRGLTPVPGAVNGMAGEVRFPTLQSGSEVPLEGAQLRKLLSLLSLLPLLGGSPPPTPPQWALRENVDLAVLGMPRDLNGDSLVDAFDHSGDYVILPVQVRVEWVGRSGTSEFNAYSMLTEYRAP